MRAPASHLRGQAGPCWAGQRGCTFQFSPRSPLGWRWPPRVHFPGASGRGHNAGRSPPDGPVRGHRSSARPATRGVLPRAGAALEERHDRRPAGRIVLDGPAPLRPRPACEERHPSRKRSPGGPSSEAPGCISGALLSPPLRPASPCLLSGSLPAVHAGRPVS